MDLFHLQITSSGSVTQESGPVHPLACASPLISCVMGRLTVPRGRMKLTPLLGATAVSTNTTNVKYTSWHLISPCYCHLSGFCIAQVSGDVPLWAVSIVVMLPLMEGPVLVLLDTLSTATIVAHAQVYILHWFNITHAQLLSFFPHINNVRICWNFQCFLCNFGQVTETSSS